MSSRSFCLSAFFIYFCQSDTSKHSGSAHSPSKLYSIFVSFSVSFFIFSILYILITRCRYDFYYSSSFYKMLIPLFTLLCIAFVGSFIIDKRLSYSCMISAFIVCLLLSLYGLNLRLQLIKLKQ